MGFGVEGEAKPPRQMTTAAAASAKADERHLISALVRPDDRSVGPCRSQRSNVSPSTLGSPVVSRKNFLWRQSAVLFFPVILLGWTMSSPAPNTAHAADRLTKQITQEAKKLDKTLGKELLNTKRAIRNNARDVRRETKKVQKNLKKSLQGGK